MQPSGFGLAVPHHQIAMPQPSSSAKIEHLSVQLANREGRLLVGCLCDSQPKNRPQKPYRHSMTHDMFRNIPFSSPYMGDRKRDHTEIVWCLSMEQGQQSRGRCSVMAGKGKTQRCSVRQDTAEEDDACLLSFNGELGTVPLVPAALERIQVGKTPLGEFCAAPALVNSFGQAQ